MHISSLIASLAAISVASGAATAKTKQIYNVYFKNEAGVPEIPIGASVSDYNGLNWGPFTLATSIGNPLGNIGGVVPSTQPKSAYYSGITQYFTEKSSVTASGRTKYFALHGFHFGCAVNDFITSGLNTPCTIDVVGSLAGKQVGAASFSFSPSNPLSAPMAHFLLPSSFRHIDTVSFRLAQSSVTVPATALLIDNIYYTVYY